MPVVFQSTGGERTEATCHDISLGGMFIEVDAPAPYGVGVVVFLELPGVRGEVEIASTVRWTKKGSGMGVQFGVMGARETHALVELIHGVASIR